MSKHKSDASKERARKRSQMFKKSKKNRMLKKRITIGAVVISSLVVVILIANSNFGITEATKSAYVAPYLTYTHPCDNHVPTCKAELTNTLVRYTVDEIDGSHFVESSVTTGDDGFFEVVVPTRKNYVITMIITLDGTDYQGSAEFGSYTSSSNCITEGKLFQVPESISLNVA